MAFILPILVLLLAVLLISKFWSRPVKQNGEIKGSGEASHGEAFDARHRLQASRTHHDRSLKCPTMPG